MSPSRGTAGRTIVVPVPLALLPARITAHAVGLDLSIRVRRVHDVRVVVVLVRAAVGTANVLVDRVSSVWDTVPDTNDLVIFSVA